MFRVLRFNIRVILMAPFYIAARYSYEKKHRKIAESMVIYRRDDGTIVTDAAERESLRKKYKKKEEAEERARQLERLKQIYGYKDF